MSPQERDNSWLNQWVLVHNTGRALDSDKARYGVLVEYLIGFVYVDRETGMRMNLESYCTVSGDSITLTKGPRDDKSYVILHYDIFKDADVKILTAAQCSALNLPAEPDWLKHYQAEGQAEIDRMRTMPLLHPLRAPGFPDDIIFALIPQPPNTQIENVWGRLVANPQADLFIVRLLVQPYQDFGGIKMGDYLVVQVKLVPQGISSVCVGKATPKIN